MSNDLIPQDPRGQQLTPTTRKKIEAVVRSIDQAKSEGDRITQITRQEIERVSGEYNRLPSGVLAGIVGGVIGAGGGFALSTTTGALLAVTGPLGLAMGAALSIYAFRGRSYRRLERATQKLRGALDVIKSEISGLPSDAPKEVKDHLWAEYKSLISTYTQIARESLDDDLSDVRGSRQFET